MNAGVAAGVSPPSAGLQTDLAALAECMSSPKRLAELRAIDAEQIRGATTAGTDVPASIKETAARLASAAKLGTDVRVTVRPLKPGVLNAMSTTAGTLAVSPRLWGPELNLSPEEVAAALAVELAQVEARRTVRGGCEELVLVGDSKLSVRQAKQRLAKRVLGSDTRLAEMLLQRARQEVASAHKRAPELLKNAGFSPAAFASYRSKLEAFEDAQFANRPAAGQVAGQVAR